MESALNSSYNLQYKKGRYIIMHIDSIDNVVAVYFEDRLGNVSNILRAMADHFEEHSTCNFLYSISIEDDYYEGTTVGYMVYR